MKKLILLFVITVLTITLAMDGHFSDSFISEAAQTSNTADIMITTIDSLISNLDGENKPIYVDACYSDGVSTFKELKKNSHAIVRVIVKNQVHDSIITTTSFLNVIDVLKGKVPSDIVLFQLGNDSGGSCYNGVLEIGTEYILFICEQESENYNNVYYVTAATAGIFKIENETVLYKDSILILENEFTASEFGKLPNFEKWILE